jgi:hypothetical protein
MDDIQRTTDEAIDRGHRNADDRWKTMALECVKVICLRQQEFTMNDVRWLVLNSRIKTQDNRAMGGVMKTAVKLGWIKPTGRSIVSKVGHKSPLQIWHSNLYQQTLFG